MCQMTAAHSFRFVRAGDASNGFRNAAGGRPPHRSTAGLVVPKAAKTATGQAENKDPLRTRPAITITSSKP
jgi:hypothetical protein